MAAGENVVATARNPDQLRDLVKRYPSSVRAVRLDVTDRAQAAAATGTAPAVSGLDCHFEPICESCAYFQTTHEFRLTLERQRDDAAERGQVGRLKIFDRLLIRLEQQAS